MHGIYLNTSGAPIGSPFAIAADAGNQALASVRFASGKYIVVWNSGIESEDGELAGGDVYGTFITLPACAGDCHGDRMVTVDELITMVNIALGTADVGVCMAGDVGDDGEITIDEIITAMNKAQRGC